MTVPPFHRILVVHRSFAEPLVERLHAMRPDLELRARAPGTATAADLAWADALVGFRRPPGGLGKARWVHCTGAGVDGWTDGMPWPSHVRLTRSTESFAVPIGEHVLARILAAAQELPQLVRDQDARRWREFVPRQIHGTCAVVVGTGDLGQGIAVRLAALGIEVIGVSRSGRSAEHFAQVTTPVHLASLVTRADWLVLAAPLTAETRGMIDDTVLAGARGLWLVNVARSALVDEQAMRRALDDGRLAGAALDVFPVEPLPPASPLWSHPGMLISPHVAGVTSIAGAAKGFVATLTALERGEDPPNLVDPNVGY